MAGITNVIANATLDKLAGVPTPTGLLPATLYVGLLLANPNNDGTGVVEPAGNGYARVSRANNLTEWPAASGRIKTHANDIVFPAASGGNWGTITHVGIFDAASGGTLLAFGALNTPRQVLDTDVFRFLAGFSPLQIQIP